ncbi:MAG: dCMP deaminase family protein [Fermentimonas sp.]|nr:dCMP deaminase family protein [Fermentimonas sp.]
MNRISKSDYYLGIAEAVSKRSTCLRRQYGAIIVQNDEIIATGYNGSPRNSPNCCDVGKCWREENNIPHGEKYEACLAVHAEQNAIISAARRDMIGSAIYLVGFEDGKRIPAEQVRPCKICEKMITNSGIASVVTDNEK